MLNPDWFPPIPLGECHRDSGSATSMPLWFRLLGIGVMEFGFGMRKITHGIFLTVSRTLRAGLFDVESLTWNSNYGSNSGAKITCTDNLLS
jgi:hypothetical protein